MAERKAYLIKNGEITEYSLDRDPVELLESRYIEVYGVLPFTPHNELMSYMDELEQTSNNKRLKLKDRRESLRITIPDMAELLGMTKDGYVKIESGKNDPSLKTAFKIAKLLGTAVDVLFGI